MRSVHVTADEFQQRPVLRFPLPCPESHPVLPEPCPQPQRRGDTGPPAVTAEGLLGGAPKDKGGRGLGGATSQPGEGRPAGGGTWAPHSIRTGFPAIPALATPALFCAAKSRVNSSSAGKGGACRSYELQLQIEEQHQSDAFLSKPYLIPSAFTPNITHLITVSLSAALPSKMKNKKVPFPSPRKVASFDRLYPPRNRT